MEFSPLSPKIRAFLEPPRHAVIATHDPDGEIRQAVVWYALDGNDLVMNALAGRRWPNNLARDPRLSVTVFEGEDYVILRGVAVVIDEPERGMAEARALAVRYGSDPDVHLGQHRIRIVFTPADVALHGELASG